MKKPTLIVAALISLATSATLADGIQSDNKSTADPVQSAVYQADWSQRNTSLRVIVTDGFVKRKNGESETQLPNRKLIIEKIGDDGSVATVFSYDTMDNFLTAYVTGEEGSDFYTAWVTGSAYRFIVYAYEDGKVVSVLDVGTRTIPEIVLQHDGTHAIVVSNTDWVKGKDGASKKTFVSADIYKWDGQTYKLYKKSIPWAQRLSVVE